MRRLSLLVPVISLIACARSQPTASDDPDRAVTVADADRSPDFAEPPPPDQPAPNGCVVRAAIPTSARLGSYPSIEVSVAPAIQFNGGPNPPRLIIEPSKPDGKVETTPVELLYPPVCAFCLPAPGSSGCEHDCRWEPFTGDRYGISRELTVAGEYRVSLRLENYACAIEGGEAVLTVTP